MNTIKLENKLQHELNDLMQKGYKFAMSFDSIAASSVWINLWKKIKDTMRTYNLEYVEELENAFHGVESIYNWSADFEMELGNATRKDKDFAQSRIDFCNEYIDRYRDKNEPNLLNMKRAIAESYFDLGRSEEGDRLFQKYLEESPTWGWGWIGWSDQYWMLAQEGNKNSEKAIHILKQALKVEGLKDKFDVLERLDDLYTELDMFEKSAEIKKRIIDQVRVNNARRSQISIPTNRKAVPVTSTKIGRNEPCPCGSGQKYKTCCGK